MCLREFDSEYITSLTLTKYIWFNEFMKKFSKKGKKQNTGNITWADKLTNYLREFISL